jgi:hypothetical protein
MGFGGYRKRSLYNESNFNPELSQLNQDFYHRYKLGLILTRNCHNLTRIFTPDMSPEMSAERKRMESLEEIASMGTSDERLLHNLITRYDQCQLEVNGIHRKIALLVSPGGVRR